ncbi:hypothetical protein TGME49_235670 [Toxoplasma gondii ME49]|uniref:Uncharacterized protein n=3 Tax=Toxoplasma gondii TaxID=5811 RepID=A0A086JHE7_TOXGO|nr:hypothetical protein TGME49_235670 [Toxoplasma gondii ME49]EPT26716.1 hypothetical protein TGME49_235670 [Toxoplasma gondii ME49]KFG31565.1 hypothetical protein TGDOM2_235670 [Toxoplasma gondii GAB2-2007-GAL-DOM2]|eukprot:XP_002368962.1 hypothetical protein TGME49_235670 [Toxoplasma gondii ME49]
MSLSSTSYAAQQELINSRTEAVFAALHLRSFVLRLPIVNVADAEKTRQGIYEKILKNRSFSCTRSNPRDELTRQPNPDVAAKQTEEIVEMLSAPSSVGFVLVVVEESVQKKGGSGQAEYCPVGGGIVEVVDEYERSIRGMWCRRSLPPDFSALLMKALCLRVFAQAFEWPEEPSGGVGASPGGAAPGAGSGNLRGAKNPYRLVSCTEKALLLFPRDAVKFLTESLMLSKHWETELDGGSHNDHPTVKCKCQKLSKLPGAWQFYGICESRFLNYWRPGLQFRNFLPDAPAPALCDFLRARQGQGRHASNGRRGAPSLSEEAEFKENLEGDKKEVRGARGFFAEGGSFSSSSNGLPDSPFLADPNALATGPGTRLSSRRQQHQLLKQGRAAFAAYAASYSHTSASASPSAAFPSSASGSAKRRNEETLRGRPGSVEPRRAAAGAHEAGSLDASAYAEQAGVRGDSSAPPGDRARLAEKPEEAVACEEDACGARGGRVSERGETPDDEAPANGDHMLAEGTEGVKDEEELRKEELDEGEEKRQANGGDGQEPAAKRSRVVA